MPTLGNGVTIDETSWNSPNYTPASRVQATFGYPRTITGVTVHHWGSDGQSFNNVANYLSRSGGNTSAHVVLQADRVASLISPDNAAWHSGSAQGNAQTIGIECRPEMSDGDVETLCQYIAYLEGIYGSLNVYVHQDWSSTACPGRYVAKRDYIVSRVNAIRAGAPAKTTVAQSVSSKTSPVAASSSADVRPRWTVEKGDTLSKIARYYYGEASKDTIDRLKRHNGLGSDSLRVGQTVFIPGPLYWTVEHGDSWEKIAGYYGYAAEYVKGLNPSKTMTVGTVLTIYKG